MEAKSEVEQFIWYVERRVAPPTDGDRGTALGDRVVDRAWAAYNEGWYLVPTVEGWLRISEHVFSHLRIRPDWIPSAIVDDIARKGLLIVMKQPRPKPALYRWAGTIDLSLREEAMRLLRVDRERDPNELEAFLSAPHDAFGRKSLAEILDEDPKKIIDYFKKI